MRSSKANQLVTGSLAMMSALFLLGTATQIPLLEGFVAFGAQYAVHIGLAVVTLLVIPLNQRSLQYFANACMMALILLAACDLGYYGFQVLNNQPIGIDYTHRWFGDGYLFLTPFLLARIFGSNGHLHHQNINRQSPFLMSLMIGLLLIVIMLSGGTGARSTYGILALELLFFISIWILRKRSMTLSGEPKRVWVVIGQTIVWVLVLASVLIALRFLFSVIAPHLFDGTLNRSLQISDRVQNAWLPGIDLITQVPWFGHGFGRQAWDRAFTQLQLNHPQIQNFGSPHNWFLSAGFFGGIFAVLAQLLFSGAVLWSLYKSFTRSELSQQAQLTKNCSLGLAVGFIAFYCLRGQVELTIYKYLCITLVGFGLIQALDYQSEQGQKSPNPY
ncbi:O-antigen ligase family protein [Polynucleobacter paludilacus]|nr:O-antigen ligase family protein [Polynucleobacter paludilacus]